MNTVIFGAGQVGSPLAGMLLARGHEVRVAKRSPGGIPSGAQAMLGDAANLPFCIEAAASMPGAKKARYVTPPSAAAAPVSADGVTRRPMPAPMAIRNRTGLATLITTVPRHRRLYCRHQ